MLRGVVGINQALLRAGLVPRLYSSKTKYVLEKNSQEVFADALTTWKRGRGDCDRLSAWRLAELLIDWRAAGKPGKRPKLWFRCRRKKSGKGHIVHVTVVLSDGTHEDPSLVMLRKQRRIV